MYVVALLGHCSVLTVRTKAESTWHTVAFYWDIPIQ